MARPRPTREQIKAIKAKYRDTKSIDRFDLMVKNLKTHGLMNHRMNATDIAFSHKENFGGVGQLGGWTNPHYTGYFNSTPESDTKKKWENMSSKQRYSYLRPTFTEQWAKEWSKKKWSELNSQQRGIVGGVEMEIARNVNRTSRDASRFGQGNYGKAVPKNDKRSGKHVYENSKRRNVRYN